MDPTDTDPNSDQDPQHCLWRRSDFKKLFRKTAVILKIIPQATYDIQYMSTSWKIFLSSNEGWTPGKIDQ